MANLTASRVLEYSGRTETLHVILPSGTSFFKGGVVQLDAATGKAKKPADVAGEFGVGVLIQDYPDTGADRDAVVEIGKIWVPFSGAQQADVGDWVFPSDDQTVTKTALVNGGPMGRAVDFKTGYLLIDFRAGGPKTLTT